jgi:hypothetical protein
MATVQSIIDSARYDLVDFVDGIGVGIEYDDTELLNYLNRMIGIMDSTLSSLGSDLVLAVDDSFTSTAGLDYVDISTLNSGLWTRIRRVWYDNRRSSDQVTLEYLYYRRQYTRNLLDNGDAIASGDYCKIISQSTKDFTTIGAADNNNGTYFTASGALTLGSGDAVWRMTAEDPYKWALHGTDILLPTCPSVAKVLTIEYDQKTATKALTDSMPYTDLFNEFLREMVVMNAKAKKQGVVEKSDVMFQDLFRMRAMQEEIQRGFVPRNYNYTEF